MAHVVLANALAGRSWLELKKDGRNDKWIDLCEEALEHHSRNVFCLESLGSYYAQQGNIKNDDDLRRKGAKYLSSAQYAANAESTSRNGMEAKKSATEQKNDDLRSPASIPENVNATTEPVQASSVLVNPNLPWTDAIFTKDPNPSSRKPVVETIVHICSGSTKEDCHFRTLSGANFSDKYVVPGRFQPSNQKRAAKLASDSLAKDKLDPLVKQIQAKFSCPGATSSENQTNEMGGSNLGLYSIGEPGFAYVALLGKIERPIGIIFPTMNLIAPGCPKNNIISAVNETAHLVAIATVETLPGPMEPKSVQSKSTIYVGGSHSLSSAQSFWVEGQILDMRIDDSGELLVLHARKLEDRWSPKYWYYKLLSEKKILRSLQLTTFQELNMFGERKVIEREVVTEDGANMFSARLLDILD